jgi:hypothetical protein
LLITRHQSCQRDVPTFRQLKAAIVPPAGEQFENKSTCVCGAVPACKARLVEDIVMTFPRRRFLHLAAAAAALPAVSRTASALAAEADIVAARKVPFRALTGIDLCRPA